MHLKDVSRDIAIFNGLATLISIQNNSLNLWSFKMYESKKQRLDSLQYVQSMLGQLRQMADAERCDMLSYLIEMAYVECSDIVRGDRPSRVSEEKRRAAA
jgi:hypothetical protein